MKSSVEMLKETLRKGYCGTTISLAASSMTQVTRSAKRFVRLRHTAPAVFPLNFQQSSKKGISLPTNMIIVVVIAALVLVALGAFFITTSGSSMSDAEAQRIFANGCVQYCKPGLYDTFTAAFRASQNDPNFIKACTRLGYGDGQNANRCLEKCPGCNVILDKNERDANGGMDRIFNTLTSTPS